MGSALRQFCTFFVDGLFMGVPVERVQEVIRFQRMTRVPLAPPIVRGLINLRGQIVTAIDLRHRLDLAPSDTHGQPMNVVVRTDEGVVSLLVDEIGDVREVSTEMYEPSPETLLGEARQVIRGAYKLADGLLLELDVERAASVPSQFQCQTHAGIPLATSTSLP